MNSDFTRLAIWMCAFFAITLTMRLAFLIKNILQSGRDVIKEALQQSGGEMLCSNIMEQTDFSKARVEVLLMNMEKKDMIQKAPHGEDILVKLIK